MSEVLLYTDGACSGNPGPGGWAAILVWGTHRREVSGGFRLTTNNRMEMMAIIEGLQLLKRSTSVTIVTDSRLIVDAFEKRWINSWMANRWVKSDKTKVKNAELWAKINGYTRDHKIKFQWVKGHSGHPENDRCDQLAVAETKKQNLPADEVYERENSN